MHIYLVKVSTSFCTTPKFHILFAWLSGKVSSSKSLEGVVSVVHSLHNFLLPSLHIFSVIISTTLYSGPNFQLCCICVIISFLEAFRVFFLYWCCALSAYSWTNYANIFSKISNFLHKLVANFEHGLFHKVGMISWNLQSFFLLFQCHALSVKLSACNFALISYLPLHTSEVSGCVWASKQEMLQDGKCCTNSSPPLTCCGLNTQHQTSVVRDSLHNPVPPTILSTELSSIFLHEELKKET